MFKKNKYSYTDDNTKLWRYMSFSKFLDLIETSSLFFCRIDCFEDNLEATQPDGAHVFSVLTQNPWQVFQKQCVDKQLEILRNMTFANCWHINPGENPDMWNNYVMLHGNEGVAIQTSFGRLSECFNTSRILTNLEMKYVNYSTENIDYSYPNYLTFLSIKDLKFQYENELRIITLEKTYPEFDPDEMSMDEEIRACSHTGEHIKVNLKTLIEKIFLSPNSTERFRDSIEQLLIRYGIDAPIVKSSVSLE